MRRIIHTVFFGNYFYGICAVALAVEASLQQGYPLNGFFFYLFLFCATVWFYTKAYITEQHITGSNQRTNWYSRNHMMVRSSQRIMLSVIITLFILFLVYQRRQLAHITITQYLLMAIFPLSGILYYGAEQTGIGTISLRNIGWLKPFIIGWCWAGIVNIYPVLYHDISHNLPTSLNAVSLLLFLKNVMFITVLCIMFDIKDYATDSNRQLKTFVVEKGLRTTIFSILLPLSIAGLASFLLFGWIRQFSIMKILLNTIPFLCLIIVAYSLHKRRNIMYYLILIDGLMLLKAFCGITAMLLF